MTFISSTFAFPIGFHGLTKKISQRIFHQIASTQRKKETDKKNTSCKNHLITINAMSLDSV